MAGLGGCFVAAASLIYDELGKEELGKEELPPHRSSYKSVSSASSSSRLSTHFLSEHNVASRVQEGEWHGPCPQEACSRGYPSKYICLCVLPSAAVRKHHKPVDLITPQKLILSQFWRPEV